MPFGDEGEDPPLAELQALMSTKLGKALYVGQGMKLQWQLFTKEIERGLKHLVHNGCAAAEISSFELLMKKEVAALKSQGHRRFDKRKPMIPYLGHNVMHPVSDIQDV